MKERVKKRVQEILQALGFISKVQANSMTNEDWNRFHTEYQAKFGISLSEDNEANDEPETQAAAVTPELQAEVINFVAGLQTDTPATLPTAQTVNPPAAEASPAANAPDPTQPTFESAIRMLMGAVTTLARQPEATTPVATVQTDLQVLPRVLGACAHSETHLFGIDHPLYARSQWFNQATVTRQLSDTALSTSQVNAFSEAFNEFTRSLCARVQTLDNTNQLRMLDFKQMATGAFAIDYGSLNIKFGEEYLVRRQDMIIAYLRTLKSVDHIFPWRSGIQDGEVIPVAGFGEFSQRYQAGEVFKGSARITYEIARVSDAMIKYKFEDLIQLEKQYIGDLNKEGSDVMKWTFIEWLMVNIYKSMFNEQVRRRVVGVLVPIQKDVENPAMFAADGALRAIERVEEECKVLPFKNLKTYTKSTIVDYIETMFEEVNKVLPSLDGMKLFINEKHVPWYRQGFRDKYGTDTDYTGPKMQAIDYSLEQFVPVPNMDYNDYKMWITFPGNVESLQHLPSEMYNIYFERRLEALLVMSRWKEGAALQMAGLQCANETELEQTNRKYQWLFTNYPVTVLGADIDSIDASVNTQFLTSDNTKATAITNIMKSSPERVIKIICGGKTNATKINKAGKFEKITADWIPTAVGDYIKLYPELHVVEKKVGNKTLMVTEPTGNWLELERKVTPSA